jgi:3-hydroxyacyl-CoA dehydrogenase/enoyl-CoA hydratase/3-hydroxybutyryl-CoA epimerase/enoyl-CoA isomerase
MIFDGQSISVSLIDSDAGPIAELKFDNKAGSVNKFDQATIDEMAAAAAAIGANESVKGLLVTSGKPFFIVGADITEFGSQFARGDDYVIQWMAESNLAFTAIEDLDIPSVTAINGLALGGGLEICLCTDFRVMADTASIGVPEVTLGLIPGYGGTVRLARLMGAAKAIEWVATGKPRKAQAAIADGAVDAVVPADDLYEAATAQLVDAINGDADWRAARAVKMSAATDVENLDAAVAQTMAASGPYPAAGVAAQSIKDGIALSRDEALKVEHLAFTNLAMTDVSDALIGLFLNDQVLKKLGKGYAKQASPVKLVAGLGAGIMGGGIAYQSSVTGTPIVMKDIADAALDLGMSEATKLLNKQVSRGRMDEVTKEAVLSSIQPTLDYSDFADVDLVIEAVVENPKIKQMVLAETEKNVKPTAILTSNTSSISITHLAEALARPENFCGMHFFNPVHAMLLVEVIVGEKTSPETIATAVAQATKMRKIPIVVKDCPGFLVNRILFPYFFGFFGLLNDGADFRKIDKVMQMFGWPMGPAYLNDVVGIDTSHHILDVLSEGYPDRMAMTGRTALQTLYDAKRFGQKNSKGFYVYEADEKGKPAKIYNEEIEALLDETRSGTQDFDEQTIIERMMIPMIIETARCVEEGIVGSVNEADMGLVLGIGFPRFRGGALKYADSLGLEKLVAICDEKYTGLGKLYKPTPRMRELAASGGKFYS